MDCQQKKNAKTTFGRSVQYSLNIEFTLRMYYDKVVNWCESVAFDLFLHCFVFFFIENTIRLKYF